jgi:ribosomal protein L11 methyltransferase
VADPRWLEISLTTNGELAEAVAEVLGRYCPNGVVMERDVKFYNDEDEGTPEGPVRISAYLPVDDELEEKRARLEQSLWHLGQIQPLPEPKFKFIEDEDWMAAWKKNYQPIEVGKGLLILPAWIEQTDMTRTAIKIDPAMAFGTGTHPTTQLCLALMEGRVKAGEAVIDVGCGSGILSIGALKLGASHALGVDTDPLSTRATLSNAIINDVDDGMEVALGSVEEIRQGLYSIQQAPLVLANILAPVIIRLFDAGLAELVSPGGGIILSGILADQAAGVRAKAEEKGLKFAEQRGIADWVGMVFERQSTRK